MGITLGLGMGLRFAGSAGGGVTLLTSPFVDDFSGAGNVSGRTPTPNGGTAWTVNPEGGIVGNMVTTAAGYVQGSQGTASNWIAANGYDGKGSASAAGHLWFEFAINPTLRALDANIFCPLLFVTKNAANDYSRLEINWTTQATNKNAPYQLLAKTTGTTQTAGTFITSSNANRVTIYGGDVLGQEVSATRKISLYISGWKVIDQLDISASLTLWPENMGFSNRSVNGLPASPTMPDSVSYGDADTDGMLRLISPGHVVAKTLWGATTTSCRHRMFGEWFGSTAPAAINVRIWDAVGDTALSGYDDVPALGLTTTAAGGGNPGTFSCYIDVVAAGRPDFMQPQVRRTDLGGKVVWHKGAIKGAGLIIADFNQSRGTRFWSNIASYVMPTLPANSWTADGSTDGSSSFPTTKLNSRSHPSDGPGTGVIHNAKSHVMNGLASLAALSGHSHYCYIRAGQGGTDMTQRRVNGSGGGYSANQIFQRLLDGIDLAGDLNILWIHDEAFEVTNGATFWTNFGATESQLWKGYLDLIVSTIEAYVGHAIICILSIGPSIQATGSTGDQRAHQVNRMKAELVSTNGGFGTVTGSNPQRYYAGANEINAKKISAAEVYHLDESLAGSGDLLCQEAPLLKNREIGSTTATNFGPTINSVSRLSGTQVRVLYDLNGCSDLELLNAAAAGTAIGGAFIAGDFRYGQWFNTANTFASGSEMVPIAATKNAASGGQCSVDYTFATVPTTSYFRAPYGQNPFNRTNNATIAGDPQNQSAMLRGVLAGSNFNCLLRPYFNLANSTVGDASLDYFTVT